MGVRPLRGIFSVTLGTPWRIATFGEVNGSSTPHLTSLNSSPYLLVLALAVTALIAVVALYFAMRRRRRVLLVEDKAKAPVRTS